MEDFVIPQQFDELRAGAGGKGRELYTQQQQQQQQHGGAGEQEEGWVGETYAVSNDASSEDVHAVIADCLSKRSWQAYRRLSEEHLYDALHMAVSEIQSLDAQERDHLVQALCAALEDLSHQLNKNHATEDGGACVDIHIKNAYRMLTLLVQTAASRCECTNRLNGGGGGGRAVSSAEQGWIESRELCLMALRTAADVDFSKLWRMGLPEDAFLGLFWKISLRMFESTGAFKLRTSRRAAFDLITRVMTISPGTTPTITAGLLDIVCSYEHAAPYVAELCIGSSSSSSSSRRSAVPQSGDLGPSLVREIGRMELGQRADAKVVRNVAAFLVEMATLAPALIHANLAILLPHLGSEAYAIRSALVTIVGTVLAHIVQRKHGKQQRRHTEDDDDDEEDRDESSDQSEEENDEHTSTGAAGATDSALFGILSERVNDSSSYTRAATLRAWTKLVICGRDAGEAGTAPAAGHALLAPEHLLLAAQASIDRLHDKTSTVRKAAVQLLTATLNCHPLPISTAEEQRDQLGELREALAATEASAEPGSADPIDSGADADNNSNNNEDSASPSLSLAKEDQDADEAEEVEEAADSQRQQQKSPKQEEDPAVQQLREELQRCEDIVQFADSVAGGISRLCALLRSHTASDVSETLRCLVAASNCCVPGVDIALRNSLSLVWFSDPAVREQCVNTFVTVYVGNALKPKPRRSRRARRAPRRRNAGDASSDEEGEEEVDEEDLAVENGPRQVANTLVKLTANCSEAECRSLQCIVVDLLRSSRLPPAVFSILWDMCLKPLAGPGSASAPSAVVAARALHERKAALRLIAMASVANNRVASATHRLQALLQRVMDPQERAGLPCDNESVDTEFWAMIAAVCGVLQRVDGEVTALAPEGSQTRALYESFVERLAHLLVSPMACSSQAATEAWLSASTAMVKTIFFLAREPEAVLQQVLVQLYGNLRAEQHQQEQDGGEGPVNVLARFVHVVGEVAFHSLLHTEGMAARAKKRRQRDMLSAQEKRRDAAGQKPAAERQTTKRGDRNDGDDEDDDDDDDEEEDPLSAELGMAAAADANEEKHLHDVVEHEIVGDHLISLFIPLVVCIAANETGAYSHPLLRQAGMGALCKCMCVSTELCELHLPLVLTTLEREELVSVRGTVIVALGQMAVRFPNSVEPWNAQLYARLRDPAAHVRRTTLSVLAHLILNDLVKVKGQVSEMVMCLEDADDEIAYLSRMFFQELSKRASNPIYNLLPDITSRLCQSAVSDSSFRSCMGFLLSFIKKDRHVESLVEKFCHRFASCTDRRQQRSMAFCLSQLPVTDKSVRKLQDLLRLYKEALTDKTVFEAFKSIAGKGRKFAKPEMRSVVDEWDASLEAVHNGADEYVTSQSPAAAAAAADDSASRSSAVAEEEEEEG